MPVADAKKKLDDVSTLLLGKIGNKKKIQQQIRKEAKEQEERYVEFRKQEILANTRLTRRGNMGVSYTKSPLLKNAQYLDTDDKFPAPKMGAGMDFGVYKAHLLTKKPNPKYAVWTGKGIKEGHYIGLDIGEYLKQFKATEKSKTNRPVVDPKLDLKGEKHGNFENQPLDDDGEPLWTSESDDDTVKEDGDESLVNFETIEQAILNPKMLEFPRSEQNYSWDDDFTKLKKQKTEQQEIVRNTLRSVINLARDLEDDGKSKTASNKNAAKVTWREDMDTFKYNREDCPCNIQPKKERKNLKNVVKEPKKKKKQR